MVRGDLYREGTGKAGATNTERDAMKALDHLTAQQRDMLLHLVYERAEWHRKSVAAMKAEEHREMFRCMNVIIDMQGRIKAMVNCECETSSAHECGCVMFDENSDNLDIVAGAPCECICHELVGLLPSDFTAKFVEENGWFATTLLTISDEDFNKAVKGW